MNTEQLKTKVQEIVKLATNLKDKYTDEKKAPVNYACIFAQNKKEYNTLMAVAYKLGKVVMKTSTGPLFQIDPLETVSGKVKLLKIRIPDIRRPEQGDADFTVSDFSDFKKKYLLKDGFNLIKRPNFIMIELIDLKHDVRAYFSNPSLHVQLGIK